MRFDSTVQDQSMTLFDFACL